MGTFILLIVSFISGYLYLNWLPVPAAFSIDHLVLEFVLNPVMVFASGITFIIGFLTNGAFLRETVRHLKKKKGQKEKYVPIIISIFFYLITFIFLLFNGFWQSILFFSFAFWYGMMTYEKNKIV